MKQSTINKHTNGLGFVDLLGNIWEWTSTSVGDNYVLRVGAWALINKGVRSSACVILPPSSSALFIGLRLASDTKIGGFEMIQLTDGTYLSKLPVTVELWKVIHDCYPILMMPELQKGFNHEHKPIVNVSFNAATHFIECYNHFKGFKFRLPTSVEYDQATDCKQQSEVWSSENSNYRTHKVCNDYD